MRGLGARRVLAWAGAFVLAGHGLLQAGERIEVPDSRGAAAIPFSMPYAGCATLALVNGASGQMVRPLAQMIELAQGDHAIRWDGMDLWGRLVPAGTELKLKVITSRGLKAYYEFTPASANAIPWLSKPFGEGESRRVGGWLGDHSPPWCAAAAGDRIFLGCPLAEHGHSLILCNLDGEKMWGGGLRGWTGPELLAGDGTYVYAVPRTHDQVLRMDRDALNVTNLVATGKQRIEGVAAWGGKVYVTFALPDAKTNSAGWPVLGLQIRDAESGRLITETRHPGASMTRMAFAPDGTLYSLFAGRLCRSEVRGDAVEHRALGGRPLDKPISLAVDPVRGNRIAVGDEGRDAVFVFDPAGKVVATLGGIGPRRRGPWDSRTVDRPNGVAIDRNGKIWVVENYFTPRRVTRFGASGAVEKVFYGPPHYGGGGFLDPSLKSFLYQACEWELDWEKGTSTLRNLNDKQHDPASPDLHPGSFSYTKVGRPVYHKGRRYVVGDVGVQYNPGFVVCLLEGPVWKPCAVMASAGSIFLDKEVWKGRWTAADRKDASFIWCDRNGDGGYQAEEVELFKDAEVMGPDVPGQRHRSPFGGAYWGNRCGADFTFWGPNARLAPSRFSDSGVPIYEKKDIRRFAYPLPAYRGLKYGSEGVSQVGLDGALTVAGQPYQILPDLTVRGGDPPAKETDFAPPVLGMTYGGLSFVGDVMTESPVGEVAVLNGNGGVWYAVTMRDSLLVGTFFTGREGSWSSLFPERGMDVTHRKHDGETFFGDFVKAYNGKYYSVAGKGFHGVCRIEGLDELGMTEIPWTVTEAQAQTHRELRPTILAASKSGPARGRGRPSADVLPLARKTRNFALDGDLTDWPEPKRMAAIGRPDEKLKFDAAWDAEGLYLAYAGVTVTGNASQDPKDLFKTGFCFDLMIRTDLKQQGNGVAAGDRRVVFGRHRGEWIAMLYDYVNPKAARDEAVTFTSPVKTTRAARVVRLPGSAAAIAFKELGPAGARDGKTPWSAEVRLAWAALDLAPAANDELWADVGILGADSGGLQVDRRAYWSNVNTEHVSDLAVEAEIHPGAWGRLRLRP